MNFSKVLIILIIGLVAFYIGREIYFTPKFVNGEVAANFTGTMPSGETIQLSDLKGKYVLLDFWGSWCGPCRKESPNLVKLYDEFHGKQFDDANDFEIVSVGIETNKDRWLSAIQKDGLHWKYHVSEISRFESEIANLYGVREIPTKFLINEDGLIIGVNQSVEEIEKFLRARMKKGALSGK